VTSSFAGRFARVEPCHAAVGFVTGLLADLQIKTCWQLAEQAGHGRPDAMQRLLYRAKWDADAVRGVQRQYTGTAGRIENAQVGVFLAYASRHGHTLIDRRVYLPKSWTDDRQRCEQAGVPDDIVFATRSELADDMITAAVKALIPARWVAADEAYGNNTRLRGELRKLRSVTSWRSPAITWFRSTAVRPAAAPTSGPRTCRPRRGPGAVPVTGRKGHGSTTGPGWPTVTWTTTVGTVC
jgi:hypothetical protein